MYMIAHLCECGDELEDCGLYLEGNPYPSHEDFDKLADVIVLSPRCKNRSEYTVIKECDGYLITKPKNWEYDAEFVLEVVSRFAEALDAE